MLEQTLMCSSDLLGSVLTAGDLPPDSVAPREAGMSSAFSSLRSVLLYSRVVPAAAGLCQDEANRGGRRR